MVLDFCQITLLIGDNDLSAVYFVKSLTTIGPLFCPKCKTPRIRRLTSLPASKLSVWHSDLLSISLFSTYFFLLFFVAFVFFSNFSLKLEFCSVVFEILLRFFLVKIRNFSKLLRNFTGKSDTNFVSKCSNNKIAVDFKKGVKKPKRFF
jgi:hypothetical protein